MGSNPNGTKEDIIAFLDKEGVKVTKQMGLERSRT